MTAVRTCLRQTESYAPTASLNASMYACSFDDGPYRTIPSGRSGWL